MYLGSAYLKNRIETAAKKADLLTGHAVVFEEFIALPFFGQIILRFNLNKEGFTEGNADRYERMLRIAAGEELLTDFMGSVYQKAGMNFSLLEGRLKELNRELCGEEIRPSVHAEGIRSDAATLLKAAGIDQDLPVWEIQPEGDIYHLLLMGKESKKIRETKSLIK